MRTHKAENIELKKKLKYLQLQLDRCMIKPISREDGSKVQAQTINNLEASLIKVRRERDEAIAQLELLTRSCDFLLKSVGH
jgi:hypothetical protein